MRIGQYKEFTLKALKHRRRVLDVGPPGVGKTAIRRQACKELGMDYIGICGPLQSPVKVGGYPRPAAEPDGDATHQLFNGIAQAFRATKPTHLHIDDLGMANGETAKALVDLVQFGRIDSRTLPDCVVVGASSNDIGHGADVQGLIEPLKSRFHAIVPVETHVDDLVPYGLAKGWPAWELAWIRNDPAILTEWKPIKSLKIEYCTPRGLEYLAEWDAIGEEDPEVWAGCIGKGAATKAIAFKGLINDLPDVDAILIDPKSAPVPENPSARLLVSMALASKMTAANFGQVVTYTSRLPQMFRAYTVRDAFRAEAARKADKALPKDWRALASSRDFAAWSVSEDGKAIMSAAS
jgi:hypothetical protein